MEQIMKKIDLKNLSLEEQDLDENEIHPDLVEAATDDSSEELNDIDMSDLEVGLEELSEEINIELQTNARALDVSDNLMDVASIVENSSASEISDTEKQLVAASVNMAVAGTDEDANELAPSMESFQDKVLLISELRNKCSIANESIMESIKSVFSKLADFLKGLFNFAARMEASLKETKAKVAKLSNLETKEVTVFFRNAPYLIKNAAEYVSGVGEYKALLKKTNKFYATFAPLAVNSVADFNGSVSGYFKTLFKPNDTFDEASKLYNSYINNFVKNVITLPGMLKVNNGDVFTNHYISEPMIGGTYVKASAYIKTAEANPDNISEMKNTITNSGVTIYRYKDKNKNVTKNDKKFVTFTATVEDLNQIITESEKALATFKVFINKSYRVFKAVAALEGSKFEMNKWSSLHTLIVNRGINNCNNLVAYASKFSKVLTKEPLAVVNRIASSSKWV